MSTPTTHPLQDMSKQEAPVLILAGGTGGHIFPGLAVAAELRARGIPVVWLGADGGMETRLVPQHDIPLETIAISGLRGKGVGALLGAPLRLLSAIRAAAKVLHAHKPRAVVSFGGFAAGPGGIAAVIAGVPLLVHEQNRAPGLTNRVLAKFARRVLTGFPDAFPGKEEVVGNPVREIISALPRPRERFAGRDDRLNVLVLGGSQGARALNEALPKALRALQGARIDVRHQCGEKMRAEAEQAYRAAGVEASIEPFIADMAGAYAWADVVVCRAGALTLAELCAAGVGSVLVPLPTAVDDHQTKNAQYVAQRRAAEMVKQDATLVDKLAGALRTLALDPARRLAMAEAARTLAKPNAAAQVVDIVLQTIASQEKRA